MSDTTPPVSRKDLVSRRMFGYEKGSWRRWIVRRFAGPPALREPTGEEDATVRVVSVMTAALHGYSAFSSAHEPQLVAQTVERFDEVVTPLLFWHDGTLVAYHGGSLMAVWNAPHEQIDHARRAATAAWEIATLDERFGGMSVSVGVATGEAMVGILGSSLRRSFMPLGRPVTDSERLAALAGPGEAYVDEATWHGAKGDMKAEAIVGMQRVGGTARQVTVYRLTSRL